tara:strand:+ start:51 stop:470 length:420 start_codon:yes stop_codon:yes gene_type:complete
VNAGDVHIARASVMFDEMANLLEEVMPVREGANLAEHANHLFEITLLHGELWKILYAAKTCAVAFKAFATAALALACAIALKTGSLDLLKHMAFSPLIERLNSEHWSPPTGENEKAPACAEAGKKLPLHVRHLDRPGSR